MQMCDEIVSPKRRRSLGMDMCQAAFATRIDVVPEPEVRVPRKEKRDALRSFETRVRGVEGSLKSLWGVSSVFSRACQRS